MLFKIAAIALLSALSSSVNAACSFTQTSCTIAGSITGYAAGTSAGSTDFLGLQSDLGDHVEYSGPKSPVCKGCTEGLTLPGYSYGIENCDDNLYAEFTTVDNGIGTTMKGCSATANGIYEDSYGKNDGLDGGCELNSNKLFYGFGNTLNNSCGCSFRCFKINKQ